MAGAVVLIFITTRHASNWEIVRGEIQEGGIMNRMTDVAILLIGLLGLVIAAWQTMAFLGARDPHSGVPDLMAGLSHLWWAIGATIITILCVVLYFVRHPRVEEEIHISR
jgi:hypothetical protein